MASNEQNDLSDVELLTLSGVEHWRKQALILIILDKSEGLAKCLVISGMLGLPLTQEELLIVRIKNFEIEKFEMILNSDFTKKARTVMELLHLCFSTL